MLFRLIILKFFFTCVLADNKRLCKDLRHHRNVHLLPKPPNCGPVLPTSKIMGGDDAEEGEFPWMVTIYKEEISNLGPKIKFCDGTILTKRFIVTAAHCLEPIVETQDHYLYVRLGEHDVSDYTTHKPVEVAVQYVLVHPQYNKTSFTDDIGIIYLTEDIQFDKESVYPICLPTTCDVITRDLSGSDMVLAGWGYLQERPTPADASVLQKIPMKAVSNAECQRSWHEKLRIGEKQLCSTGLDGVRHSPCQGDSGGPLMLRVKQSTYLLGVVSVGDTCVPFEPSDHPPVFAKVAAYTSWILDHIS